MENITLGEVALFLAFLVGLITSLSFLVKKIKEALSDMFKDQMNAINKKMDELQGQIGRVDIESTKNYLVQFLSRVEKGDEIDEIEVERFHEQYDHYVKAGGNSYIRHKVEKLKEGGLL